MGCIEIYNPNISNKNYFKINRNMGCIEMLEVEAGIKLIKGLIETWDVLK